MEADKTRQAIVEEGAASRKAITAQIFSSRAETENALLERMKAMELVLQEKKSRDRLLASLSFEGMNERRNNVTESHERTFAWFLDHAESTDSSDTESTDSTVSDSTTSTDWVPPQPQWPNFTQWLQTRPEPQGPMYWISGKPGSGKSTLFKYVVSSPRTATLLRTSETPLLVLTHYLWRPGSELQQNLKGLLCSLLHQIFSSEQHRNLMDTLPDSSRSKHSNSDWSVKELRGVLLDTLKTIEGIIGVFIDGLDELSAKDRVEDLLGLLGDMNALGSTKICVSSRPEPKLQRFLSNNATIKLQDLTYRDISRFVRASLVIPPMSSLIYYDLDDVIDTLCRKSEGVFLWAQLVLRSVQSGIDNGDTMDLIEARINSLPSDMTNLYQDMWRRLNDDQAIYHQSAALYLSLMTHWSTVSSTPISLLELAVAYEDIKWETGLNRTLLTDTRVWERLCNTTAQQIQSRCAGLLQIKHNDRMSRNEHRGNFPISREVTFIHRSAGDFFHSEAAQAIHQGSLSRWQPDDIFPRLFRGSLYYGTYFDELRSLQPNWPYEYADACQRSLILLQNAKEKLREAIVLQTLTLCQKWYTQRRLAVPDPYPLIARAASFGLLGSIERQRACIGGSYPKALDLTHALFGVCTPAAWRPPWVTLPGDHQAATASPTDRQAGFWDWCAAIQDLIHQGARANTVDLLHMDSMFIRETYPTRRHRIPMPVCTPLAAFCQIIFSLNLDLWGGEKPGQSTFADDILPTVVSLARAEGVLESTATFIVPFDRYSDYSVLLLYDGFGHSLSSFRHNDAFVLEMNMAYMVILLRAYLTTALLRLECERAGTALRFPSESIEMARLKLAIPQLNDIKPWCRPVFGWRISYMERSRPRILNDDNWLGIFAPGPVTAKGSTFHKLTRFLDSPNIWELGSWMVNGREDSSRYRHGLRMDQNWKLGPTHPLYNIGWDFDLESADKIAENSMSVSILKARELSSDKPDESDETFIQMPDSVSGDKQKWTISLWIKEMMVEKGYWGLVGEHEGIWTAKSDEWP